MIEDLSLLRQSFIKRLTSVCLIFFCFAASIVFLPSAVNWIFDPPAESILPPLLEQFYLCLSILNHPFSNASFEHYLQSGFLGLSYYLFQVCICWSWVFGLLVSLILFFMEGILLLYPFVASR
jgi:hypothetical protein